MWSKLLRWWRLRKLSGRLRSPDPGQRRQAASALGQIPDARAARALLPLLGDPDDGVALEASGALVRLGGGALEPLQGTLQNDDARVAKRAAAALGELGDARAAEPLLGAVKYGRPEVRVEATRALARLPAAAVEFLVGALRDDYPYVRTAAAGALLEMGGPAVAGLEKALGDGDAGARRQAAELPGRIGDPRALEALERSVNDEAPDVRRAAAEAVARLRARPV
jgi:HEAT repeat protein